MLAVVDGSFCNRTMFRASWIECQSARTLPQRCPACVCLPPKGDAANMQRRSLLQSRFVEITALAGSGHVFTMRGSVAGFATKSSHNVLWRRGAATRPLRLIVIAPQPYKLSNHSRTNYREPAYLLTTDLTNSLSLLIQYYFDRWQIEVNHRDEKSLLGVGHAQVWSPLSIPRHPAFAVASYSMLWLAALQTFGPHRTEQFCPLPKWRKKTSRYSTLDLLTLLRKEINNETSVSEYLNANMAQNLMHYAYT